MQLELGDCQGWPKSPPRNFPRRNGPRTEIPPSPSRPHRLVFGFANHRVQIRSTSTGEVLHELVQHEGEVKCVAMSADGTTVVSGAEDRTVCVWSASGGGLVHAIQLPEELRSVAVSSDGTTFVCSCEEQVVRAWSSATGRFLHNLEGHAGPVCSVAVSADGRRIASGSDDQMLCVWDTTALGKQPVAEGASCCSSDAGGSEAGDALERVEVTGQPSADGGWHAAMLRQLEDFDHEAAEEVAVDALLAKDAPPRPHQVSQPLFLPPSLPKCPALERELLVALRCHFRDVLFHFRCSCTRPLHPAVP